MENTENGKLCVRSCAGVTDVGEGIIGHHLVMKEIEIEILGLGNSAEVLKR